VKTVLILLAIAVNLVLGAQLYTRWTDSGRAHWAEPAPIKPAVTDIATPPVPRAEDPGKYRETIERPLFSATRRPVIKPVVAAAPPKVDALKDVKVAGVYGSEERGGAILTVAGKLQRLAFGQKIGDWTLVGAQGRDANFRSDDGEKRLLKLETVVVAAPPAAAAAPRPAAAAPQPAGAAAAVAVNPSAEQQKQLKLEQFKQWAKATTERANKVRAERGLPLIVEEKDK
jgi:hypothetical protein